MLHTVVAATSRLATVLPVYAAHGGGSHKQGCHSAPLHAAHGGGRHVQACRVMVAQARWNAAFQAMCMAWAQMPAGPPLAHGWQSGPNLVGAMPVIFPQYGLLPFGGGPVPMMPQGMPPPGVPGRCRLQPALRCDHVFYPAASPGCVGTLPHLLRRSSPHCPVVAFAEELGCCRGPGGRGGGRRGGPGGGRGSPGGGRGSSGGGRGSSGGGRGGRGGRAGSRGPAGRSAGRGGAGRGPPGRGSPGRGSPSRGSPGRGPPGRGFAGRGPPGAVSPGRGAPGAAPSGQGQPGAAPVPTAGGGAPAGSGSAGGAGAGGGAAAAVAASPAPRVLSAQERAEADRRGPGARGTCFRQWLGAVL